MSWLKKNKILLIIIIFGISAFSIVKYIYKPHKKTEDLKSIFQGSPKEFKNEVLKKPSFYQNAIVEIKGEVISTDINGVMLNEAIYCSIKDTSIVIEKVITIKGRFIGYDDLLEEFKIDKCIIKNE